MDIETRADMLIEQDVYANQNMLIEHLLNTSVFNREDIENYYQFNISLSDGELITSDSLVVEQKKQTVIDTIDMLDDKVDNLLSVSINNQGSTKGELSKTQIVELQESIRVLEDDLDTLDNAVDYPQDIHEWYIVSDYLFEELRTLGEPVLNNDYGKWWGRTCTGQSIKLDGTFQEIAKRILHRANTI